MHTKRQKRIKFCVYLALYVITFAIVFSVFVISAVTNYSFPLLRIVIISFASVLLMKYFIYMVISPWYDVITALKDRKYRKEIQSYNPRVSVMVPAWNESHGVLETLKTIIKSTHTNLEVVVVNDGSTDNSDKLIRNFKSEYDNKNKNNPNKVDIIYHYKENGGKGAALNTAIELATGEILMSIDADCILLPDTIKNFVHHFVDPTVMAAVGNVKVGNTQTIVGIVQHLEFIFSFYFKKADSVMNTIYIIGGAAGAFRRETIETVGRYNTKNITEDIELSVRIQDAGMKIVYAADAIIYTEGASDINGLMKQRLRWKRGRFETFLQHKHLFFSTQSKHNVLLSWFILPLAWFGELQLAAEPFFLMFLYVYSFLIRDFSSFISGIIVVGFMFFVQMAFDDKKSRKVSFLMLAVIGWLLFYVSTFVEFNALFNSIFGLVRKKELKWQKWERKGVGIIS
jgi:biofilm PGA synthesis N-glycosyltransferase PgaC